MAHSPRSLVTVVNVCPVSGITTVTVAFGTAAADGSTTVPSIRAVVPCANATAHTNSHTISVLILYTPSTGDRRCIAAELVPHTQAHFGPRANRSRFEFTHVEAASQSRAFICGSECNGLGGVCQYCKDWRAHT